MIKRYPEVVYEWLLDKIIGLLELIGLSLLWLANIVFTLWVVKIILGWFGA